MNGFLSFDSFEQRDAFVRSELESRPEMQSHYHVVGSRPDVVVQNVTPDDLSTLKNAVQGRGTWFDDVQFRTMGD